MSYKAVNPKSNKSLWGYNSTSSIRMLVARSKQSYAMRLRLMGYTMQEIADAAWPPDSPKGKPTQRLYQNRQAAHKAVNRELQELKEEQSLVLDKIVNEQVRLNKQMEAERYVAVERLMMLLNPMMLKALAGDTVASDMAIKIILAMASVGGYLPNSPRRKNLKTDNSGSEALSKMLKAAKEHRARKEAAVN